jgi:ribosomal protein L11 methyltransferase
LTELTKRRGGKSGLYNRPYKDLYIYLLNGTVAEKEEKHLGAAFVGNWVEDDSSFLFFGQPADKEVDRLLGSCPELELIETHHFTYEQWQGGGLEPFRIDDFVVVPPWEKELSEDTGIRILLDPGVVFGNGLHPTTRDCLKALSLASRHRPFKKVLDLGTGTGVLALAAARLGAESVLGVDINPLCIKTALKNVELNGLQEIIRMADGPAENYVDEPADLVVANIHHAVIERLLDSGVFRDAERFIISGLMRSQYRDVKSRLEMNRFRLLREWDHDMTWFTCLAEKNSGD